MEADGIMDGRGHSRHLTSFFWEMSVAKFRAWKLILLVDFIILTQHQIIRGALYF